MTQERISIVIPVRNGGPFIGKQLDALLEQKTTATFEVIVADNGSMDDTAEVVRGYTHRDRRVRLVDASHRQGANVARNVGINAATGTYILLADADDIVHPGWIQAYWEAFQNGAHTAGGGLRRILDDGTVLAVESKLYPTRMGPGVYANGANCAFSREAFDAVEGFDESLVGAADDVDFFIRTARAGYRMELVPDAVVDKLHPDLPGEFQRHFTFGRGDIWLAKKFNPRLVSLRVASVAVVQSVLWFVLWGTVGRVPSFRRKAVTTLAFSLGFLAEEIRELSKT